MSMSSKSKRSWARTLVCVLLAAALYAAPYWVYRVALALGGSAWWTLLAIPFVIAAIIITCLELDQWSREV